MFATIIWVGFSQSLFAAIIVAAKRNPQIQDRILSAWLFMLSVEFLTCALDLLIWKIPILSSSFLLFNPAFFLYVRSLTNPKFKLKPLQLLHLAPFVLFEITAYILEQKYSLHHFFDSDSTQWFRFMFSFASISSWMVYNYLSAAMVFRHRKKLENEFSTIESTNNLKWLIFLIVFYNLYCAFSFLFAIINISLPESEITQYIYNYSTLLILIYILGFYGLRQKRIFVDEKENTLLKVKYSNSLLSKTKKQNIITKVISYVEENEAYLNPDISMTLLSDDTGIPKHQITEVFNTELGKNFFQFINGYRINEVKKMLSDSKNKYSIEAIGYDCGFSSKSSFFSVFKKITGFTPSQYRLETTGNHS